MFRFRRHLRLWTAAWLLVQMASLAALIPRDCCAAHPLAHSPMPAATPEAAAPSGDAACPMHREARAAERTPPAACSMRGTCDGPDLFTLLPGPALLPADAPLEGPGASGRATPVEPGSPLGRIPPPDPPPPRA
jgi:hypothetical protein